MKASTRCLHLAMALSLAAAAVLSPGPDPAAEVITYPPNDTPSLSELFPSTLDNDQRHRRSGVTGILEFIGSKIAPKIQLITSLSSGGGHEEEHPPPPPPPPPPTYGPPVDTYDMKSFDFWGFKKAIFNTLFQAAKALGGGILALKGQLVKVKGHLISTKGKIVTSGGEGIYNFGKSIAANAVMNVVKPASYTAPSAAYYAPPPSGGGYHYSAPQHAAPPSGPTGGHYSSGPSPHYPSGPAPQHASGPSHYTSGPAPQHAPGPSHYPSGPAPQHSSGPSPHYPSSGQYHSGPSAPYSSGQVNSYGVPYPPSTGYGSPAEEKHQTSASAHDDRPLPHGVHAGLLVLKSISPETSQKLENLHSLASSLSLKLPN